MHRVILLKLRKILVFLLRNPVRFAAPIVRLYESLPWHKQQGDSGKKFALTWLRLIYYCHSALQGAPCYVRPVGFKLLAHISFPFIRRDHDRVEAPDAQRDE